MIKFVLFLHFLIPYTYKCGRSIECFFTSTLFSKTGKKIFTLNSSNNFGYLVKPKTWLKIKFLTKYSILMVVCDMEYEFKDYIEKFDEFKKIIKK